MKKIQRGALTQRYENSMLSPITIFAKSRYINLTYRDMYFILRNTITRLIELVSCNHFISLKKIMID